MNESQLYFGLDGILTANEIDRKKRAREREERRKRAGFIEARIRALQAELAELKKVMKRDESRGVSIS